MSTLFKDVKGQLNADQLEVLLAMLDFNNPALKEILEMLKLGHRAQFSEFQKSAQAKKLRASRAKHVPAVDFQGLPAALDEAMVGKLVAYYKVEKLWQAVSSMLTADQVVQVVEKSAVYEL